MSRTATGFRAWILQRISAAWLGLSALASLGYFLLSPPETFEQWRSVVAHPGVGTLILITVLALLLHAWVGIRDVLMDYVPRLTLRFTLLSLFGLGFIACGLWALQVILLARGLA